MTLSHRRLLRPTAADGALVSGEVLSPAIAQDRATIIHDFSFAAHAPAFDRHIRDSIRGLDDLHSDCIAFSRYFVQSGTTVVDIGCSTGSLLRTIRDANEPSRPFVEYVGIDLKPEYDIHWRARQAGNVRFEVRDAQSFMFENASLAYSTFTMQFIPERDRSSLLRRINDGLVEGGALIIAEKVFANGAWSHDMLRSVYYDFKRQSFSDEQIHDKERSLRGQMNLWDEARWEDALSEAGFEFQRFWQNHLFVAWVARKGTPRRPAGIVPFRQGIERLNDRGLVTSPGTMTIRPSSEIIFIQDPALVPLLAARKRIERPNDRGLVTNPGTSEIIFIQDPALVPLLAARKRRRRRG
jgi:tRNA (cmo5U34)-methyltransferase